MITIKTEEEIQVMREGGKMLAHILEDIAKDIAPGVTTKQLDTKAEKLIKEAGAKPAFKGYEGFPGIVCTAVNEEMVHTVPSDKPLEEGDILSLDIGLIYKGMYLDMARTYPVGEISLEASHLIKTTKKSLRIGIKKARPGNTVGDIGNTIQRFVEGQGYGVVRILCGHGIGKELHEDPKIANFGKRGDGEELKQGMVICIEPMVTAGKYDLKKADDGHGYITKDGSLSAHFEDTVAITQDGAEVLTKI
ncbi:MAG: type I methionyl aminopeptidase [Patescibacteria group bacterium]|nr:type I methionyl aminopeptidase [Patescibacteria group bacterium]